MSDTPQEQEPLPAGPGQQGGGRTRSGRAGRPASRARGSAGNPGAAGKTGAGKTGAAGNPGPGGKPGSVRQRIGIRELRQHASVYVDLAEKGYTVDITNRGRLVAQLVPVKEPGSPMERLIAAGVIEPADETGGIVDLDPYPPSPAGQPTASDVLGRARDAAQEGPEAPR